MTIVWDTQREQELGRFQSSNLKRQVDALAFDTSGQYVFAAGAGDKHYIVCYSLTGLICSFNSDTSKTQLHLARTNCTNFLLCCHFLYFHLPCRSSYYHHWLSTSQSTRPSLDLYGLLRTVFL